MNINNIYINDEWAKKFKSAEEMHEALPHLSNEVITEAFNIINDENKTVLAGGAKDEPEEGGKQLDSEKPKANRRPSGSAARTGKEA